MVERVARHLATVHFWSKKHSGACRKADRVARLVNTYWRNHIGDAYVAIEAMREPPLKMRVLPPNIEAVVRAANLPPGRVARDVWQGMIDEALK
jgi:hypothetical protein